MIDVTVLICAKNAGESLKPCLEALGAFDEVIVIDSNSADNTKEICTHYNVNYIPYTWNGVYPKKRQWVLDTVSTKHDFIFFVDVDEVVTPDFIDEIKTLDFSAVGYFVKGQYCLGTQLLKHGFKNNKLVLFHKGKIEFPVIDDLGDACMGEMEGHYQPVLKSQYAYEGIEQLQTPLIHDAYNEEWNARHNRYAKWEADMIAERKYPKENTAFREGLKTIFRNMPFRPVIAFLHCYILKLGMLDGKAGYRLAYSRYAYYKQVNVFLKANKS